MSVYTLTIAKADERHTPSLRLGNGALARFCAAAVSTRPKQEADGKGAFLALLLVSPWRLRLLASGRGGCARKDRHTMYGGQNVAPAEEAIARRSSPGSRPKRARIGRRWAGSRPLIYCVRSSPLVGRADACPRAGRKENGVITHCSCGYSFSCRYPSLPVCLNGPVPHFPTPKLSSRLSRAVNRVLGKGRRYKQ